MSRDRGELLKLFIVASDCRRAQRNAKLMRTRSYELIAAKAEGRLDELLEQMERRDRYSLPTEGPETAG